MNTQDTIKINLGQYACKFIPQTGLIGLGSGSTAECFIHALAHTAQDKSYCITCLATSDKSAMLAKKLGLSLLPFEQWDGQMLDVLVDGADSIDPFGNMIKGLGGALLREKLAAYAAKKYIILIDERKQHTKLQGTLPLEILPYDMSHTIQRIEQNSFFGTIRKTYEGNLYITDNGNRIFDIQPINIDVEPEEIHRLLKCLPGVVETGLFCNLHPIVLTGFLDGSIRENMYDQ